MEQKNQIKVASKPSFAQKLNRLAIIATGSALAFHANAASSIDATGLTGEIDGSKDTVILLFGTGLVLLGIFAGWRYLKRGANSA